MLSLNLNRTVDDLRAVEFLPFEANSSEKNHRFFQRNVITYSRNRLFSTAKNG
jgi:hypothetical protein